MIQLAKPEVYGWNENGDYFKFPGGTMICCKMFNIPQGSSSLTVEFAENFINPPAISITNIFSNSSGIIWSVGNRTASSVDVYAHFSAGVPAGSSDAFLIAIGRWE